MLSPLQNYFHYSRSERKGTVLLVIVIVLLLLFYFVSDWFAPKQDYAIDKEAFYEKITSFEKSKNEVATSDSVNLFLFNPNTIGLEEWVALGFSEKQAASIENYKASGATFKIKKDVLKLFMVDEYKYAQLEPFIDLPDDYPSYDYSDNSYNYSNDEKFETKEVFAILLKESDKPVYDGFDTYSNVHYTKQEGIYRYVLMPFESEELASIAINDLNLQGVEILQLTSTKGYYAIASKSTENKPAFKQLHIDLNQADTSELKQLYGIGSGYANRIVKYRESLGGYISIAQLGEVYGLQQETIEKILPSVFIGSTTIRKIDVNLATVDELKAHPYIDWKVANSIVEIRNNYGKFASTEGIMKSVLIDEEKFQKLKPYLEAK